MGEKKYFFYTLLIWFLYFCCSYKGITIKATLMEEIEKLKRK